MDSQLYTQLVETLFDKSVKDGSINSLEKAQNFLSKHLPDKEGHLKRRLLREFKKEYGKSNSNLEGGNNKRSPPGSSEEPPILAPKKRRPGFESQLNAQSDGSDITVEGQGTISEPETRKSQTQTLRPLEGTSNLGPHTSANPNPGSISKTRKQSNLEKYIMSGEGPLQTASLRQRGLGTTSSAQAAHHPRQGLLTSDTGRPPIDQNQLPAPRQNMFPVEGQEQEQEPENEAEHQIYPFDYQPDKVTRKDNTFQMLKVNEKRYRRYAAVDTLYNVKVNKDWLGVNFKDLLQDFYYMFERVLDKALSKTRDVTNQIGRVVLKHHSLSTPIVVPLMKLEDLTAGVILEKIERTLNSNESLAVDASFDISIGTIKKVSGMGRIHPINMENIKRKRSIITINNDDRLCFQRAVAVGWAKLHLVSKSEWDSARASLSPQVKNMDAVIQLQKVPPFFYKDILKKGRVEQKRLAINLANFVKVPVNRPGTLDDIPRYETRLGLHINVISREVGNKFVTPPKQGKPNIYLYHSDNHFDTITSTKGFYNASNFCPYKNKPFSDFRYHTCPICCNVCNRTGCIHGETVECSDCNRTCRSQDCFDRHKQKKYCNRYWKCPDCSKLVEKDKNGAVSHNCYDRVCFSCKERVPPEHLCYIKATVPGPLELKLLVFDFECRQDTINECDLGYEPVNESGSGCETCQDSSKRCIKCLTCVNCSLTNCGTNLHTPNLVICQTVCDLCVDELDTTFNTKCVSCGSRCPKCWKMEEGVFVRDFCPDTCGQRVKCFRGDNCGSDFCLWFFNDYHKNFTAISHYGRAYDTHIILSYLLKNAMPPEWVIYSGTKIMAMSVRKGLNIRFLDSYNFFATKLAALPKCFGFEDTSKGYFCHFFNTIENQNYVGPYPAPHYYGCDYMSEEDRKKFFSWYNSIPQGSFFNFQEEIVNYCKIDTDILLKACVKYRNVIISITENHTYPGIDPFQYTTLASLSLGIFKSLFLEETWVADIHDINGKAVLKNQEVLFKGGCYKLNGEVVDEGLIEKKKFIGSPLAYVPASGYTQRDQYSLESICYLEWLSVIRNVDIQHALNGGEKKINIGTSWYRCDGFIPSTSGATSGHVIEYMGCHIHGCPRCHTTNRDTTKLPFTGDTIETSYATTQKKKRDLLLHNYTYEAFWGCEFVALQESNSDFAAFVTNMRISGDLVPRLQIRDAFYGGRNEAVKLFYEAAPDEEIKYYDVTSLYPFINKYGKYPKGHPIIITSDFKDINSYYGVALVRILPPTNLYHPVLPYRSNNKLKFPLCARCADTESKKPCTCSDHERALLGTWTTVELEKALEKGYTILTIYEIYHWDDYLLYDPETGGEGLFSEYVNTFLKLKQEASDWPSEVKDDPLLQQQYIDNYLEHENIMLDASKIEKNPGLRMCVKITLNNLWGKMGQRLNLKQTKFITEKEGNLFFQTLTDSSKNLHNFHIINDNVIQFEYTHEEGFIPESISTNIFIAIFTTSLARLELYKIIDFLDGENNSTPGIVSVDTSKPLNPANNYPTRVLYYDTDSVIFTQKKGQPCPPLGPYLGQLTDESEGDSIRKFVCAGPKAYGYKTASGKEVCKIRGFTLNYTNKQIINMASLEELIKEWYDLDKVLVTTNPANIVRDKERCRILSKEEEKKFKMVYTKRVIQANFDTLPYGYRG